MAQNAPCIRNHKESVALSKRGHEVHLACEANLLDSRYGIPLSDQVYRSTISIFDAAELIAVSSWFDLVHVHNEPDTFAAAMTVSRVPSVHDCHDLMSARGLGFNIVDEGVANRYSDGRVYVSTYQRDRANAAYGFDDEQRPTVVCRSMVLEDDIPKTRLPKLSDGNREIHLVYEGGINLAEQTHRYLIPIFRALTEAGAYVHVYWDCDEETETGYREGVDNDRLVMHGGVDPRQLIYEMTQYDAGLCLFNHNAANNHHLQSTLPNKLFEYLAAGLPVVVSPFSEMVQFVTGEECGWILREDEDVPEFLEAFKDERGFVEVDPTKYTMEREIIRVERLYYSLVHEPRGDLSHVRFPPIEWEEIESQRSLRFVPPLDGEMVPRSLCGRGPDEETTRLESIVAHGALEDL